MSNRIFCRKQRIFLTPMRKYFEQRCWSISNISRKSLHRRPFAITSFCWKQLDYCKLLSRANIEYGNGQRCHRHSFLTFYTSTYQPSPNLDSTLDPTGFQNLRIFSSRRKHSQLLEKSSLSRCSKSQAFEVKYNVNQPIQLTTPKTMISLIQQQLHLCVGFIQRCVFKFDRNAYISPQQLDSHMISIEISATSPAQTQSGHIIDVHKTTKIDLIVENISFFLFSPQFSISMLLLLLKMTFCQFSSPPTHRPYLSLKICDPM